MTNDKPHRAKCQHIPQETMGKMAERPLLLSLLYAAVNYIRRPAGAKFSPEMIISTSPKIAFIMIRIKIKFPKSYESSNLIGL